MQPGKMVLIRLRTTTFAGTKVLGVLSDRSKGTIKVSDVCMIYDFVQQDQSGGVSIHPIFGVNQIESHGVWEYSEEDVVAVREVSEGEEIMKLYDEAYAKYRLRRAGLAAPDMSAPERTV